MNSRNEKKQQLVVDQAMLRAFAKGQLDEATEDKIVALLEERPELQAKVAAISTDDILFKMKAHSHVVAAKSLSSQIGVGPSGDAKVHTSATGSSVTSRNPVIDLPSELSELTDYRIIRELGRGGMGVVYLAEHTFTGRKEVLKVLNERLMGNPDARKRFEQEIKCIAALNHQSIVRCYTVRTMPKAIVLSMEYVEGTDLHGFISGNGRLPVHVACGIATEVCHGLQHAMKAGLVHRDIKPSNIMLYKSDGKIKAKVLDFGLARLAKLENQGGLTQDGTLLGTLEYISPEQSMDANKADIRADIYSLGCTLYHMLVGHPPFLGSAGELIMAHAQKLPPAVNLIRSELPVELAEVVARMLAKQPARRFVTPHDVANALKPFLSRKSAENPAAELSMTGAPETRGPSAEANRDTSVEVQQPIPAESQVVPRPEAISEPPASIVIDTGSKRMPQVKSSTVRGAAPLTGRRSTRHRKWLAIAVGMVGALLLGVMIFGIIKIRTANGTIVIENLPEDAEVLIDGDKVEIKWDGKQATVTAKPGERMIEVKQGDVSIEGERVVVRRNEHTSFAIHLQPNPAPLQSPDPSEATESKALAETNINAIPSSPVTETDDSAVEYLAPGQIWRGVTNWEEGIQLPIAPQGATYELTINDVDVEAGTFKATYRWDNAPSGKPGEGETWETVGTINGNQASWETGDVYINHHDARIFDDRIEVSMQLPRSKGAATLRLVDSVDEPPAELVANESVEDTGAAAEETIAVNPLEILEPAWTTLFDGTRESFESNWEYDSYNKGTAEVSSNGELHLQGTRVIGNPTSVRSKNAEFDNFHLFVLSANRDGIQKQIFFRDDGSGLGYGIATGGNQPRISGAGRMINAGSASFYRRSDTIPWEIFAKEKQLQLNQPYLMEVICFEKSIVVRVNGEVVNSFDDQSAEINKSPITLVCSSQADLYVSTVHVRRIGSSEEFQTAIEGKGPPLPKKKTVAEVMKRGTVWKGMGTKVGSGEQFGPVTLTILDRKSSTYTLKYETANEVRICKARLSRNKISWKAKDDEIQKGDAGKDASGVIDNGRLSLSFTDKENEVANSVLEINSIGDDKKIMLSDLNFTELWDGKSTDAFVFPSGTVRLSQEDGNMAAVFGDGYWPVLVTKNEFRNFHFRTRMFIDGSSNGSDQNSCWLIRSGHTDTAWKGYSFSLGGEKNRSFNGKSVDGTGDFQMILEGRSNYREGSMQIEKGNSFDGVAVSGPSLPALSRNAWHDIEFLVYGDTIEMVVDGTTVTAIRDARNRIAKGNIAFRGKGNLRVLFEKFEVKNLGSDQDAKDYVSELKEEKTSLRLMKETANISEFLPGSVWTGPYTRRLSDGSSSTGTFTLEVLEVNGNEWKGRAAMENPEWTLTGSLDGNKIAWYGKDIVLLKGGARHDYLGTIHGKTIQLEYSGIANIDQTRTVSGVVNLRLTKAGATPNGVGMVGDEQPKIGVPNFLGANKAFVEYSLGLIDERPSAYFYIVPNVANELVVRGTINYYQIPPTGAHPEGSPQPIRDLGLHRFNGDVSKDAIDFVTRIFSQHNQKNQGR